MLPSPGNASDGRACGTATAGLASVGESHLGWAGIMTRTPTMSARRSERRFWRAIPIGFVTIGLLLAGCVSSSGASGSPSASPSANPSGSPSGQQSVVQLKLRLLEQFGSLWYCDPDFYPVAHGDEQQLAEQRLPEIQGDATTFQAIVAHLHLANGASLTAAQKLAVYRTWKQLNAIQLQQVGDAYRFDIVVRRDPAQDNGERIGGTIAQDGTVTVEQRAPAGPPNCPICLARGTLIDTPSGPVSVESLEAGMAVWTLDERGARIQGVIEKVGSTRVPPTHQVVHLVLDDGRQVWVSPGHPLPNGRTVGELRPGDGLDGAVVASADLVAYPGGATFDLLPSGSTGDYWANGVLLASTLGR